MASSDSTHGISWPERRFPPINLWVLARSPVFHSHGGESTHIHRSQRPGMKINHGNTLHHFGYDRIKELLAMRGGKL